ncbi:MAG: ABC transporter ATP-binding protein [Planctomycetes bacterium]|nr:ABC transporter ATP-binding protein [Planctomycetota bacterium]
MKAIEVQALTKQYGSARGIDGLTFHVEAGEIFGYLGPNGSGKTTTIRCLMGMLRPTRGECHVLGNRVRPGRATGHNRIGYLPGDFKVWEQHTGRRALQVLGSLGHGKSFLTRQAQLAERLDLNLDRRVRALSRGNRQKIGLIYAFQHQPDLLILDEPTSGLDPLMRQVVLDLIREAAQAGATVLLSSHDLSEVAAVCQQAAILREGKLIELAPISSIVQQGQRRLKVWFAQGTPAPSLPDTLEEASLVQVQSPCMEIAYQGSADRLLKWLAQFPVERITTPDTSLEDAFIQYYQKESRHDS